VLCDYKINLVNKKGSFILVAAIHLSLEVAKYVLYVLRLEGPCPV
jgi:hypothetical protein